MKSAVTVEETVMGDARVRELVVKQEAEVMARYGVTDPGPSASPESPAALVIVNDRTVGCVAVSFHPEQAPEEAPEDVPEYAEISRMYVDPSERGRGLSKLLLERAESMAAARGAQVVRLETGLPQPEAMALYSRSGYLPIPCYGYWKDDPEVRCFEKRLAAEG